MNSKAEVLPESSAIEELMSAVVRPTLEVIARDAGRRLEVTAVIMRGESKVLDRGLLSFGTNQTRLLHGKMRLRFRQAFGGRLLMHCEALFERSEAVNNCSGFSLKAELKAGTAKRKGWTMRYTVWDWTGW